jgi:hypothetical protein
MLGLFMVAFRWHAMGKSVAAHILRKRPGRLVSFSQKGFNACRYYFNSFFIVLIVGHD